MSQLIEAIKRHASIDEIRQLIIDSNLNEKEEITQESSNGKTPLIYAVEENRQDIANLLIGFGAEIDNTDEVGNTPLLYAILNNKLEMVKFLLEKGANKDKARVADGVTPLIYAVSNEYTDITKYLIEIGCDINKCNKKRESALIFAASTCNLEIASLLIKNNCRINDKDINGFTALMHIGGNKSASDSADNAVEIAQLILKHSPPEDDCINMVNKYNKNALFCAIDRNCAIDGNYYTPLIKMLINKGGDVNIQDCEYGFSPLHTAVGYGNQEVIDILIENGSDIEAKNVYVSSALRLFATCKIIEDKNKIETNKNIILTLIKNGAIIDSDINKFYHDNCKNEEIINFIDNLSINLSKQVSLLESNIQAKLAQILSVIEDVPEFKEERSDITNIKMAVNFLSRTRSISYNDKFIYLRSLIKKLNNRMNSAMFESTIRSLLNKNSFFSNDLSNMVIEFASDMQHKKNVNESVSMLKENISDLIKTTNAIERIPNIRGDL